MLGLGAGKVVVNKQLNPEKLREWLENIPEITRQRICEADLDKG
jgi:hypothetical protein